MDDEKDLEIIRLHYRIAALELQNQQLDAQFNMGKRMANQIMHERAELAQALRMKYGLLLMPRAGLVPISEPAKAA